MNRSRWRLPPPASKPVGALVVPILVMVVYLSFKRLLGSGTMSYAMADAVFLAASMAIGSCYAAAWPAHGWSRLVVLAIYLPGYYGLLLWCSLRYTAWLHGIRL